MFKNGPDALVWWWLTRVLKYMARGALAPMCCHSRNSSTLACFLRSFGYQWSGTLYFLARYLSIATLSIILKPSSSIAGTLPKGWTLLAYSGVLCSPRIGLSDCIKIDNSKRHDCYVPLIKSTIFIVCGILFCFRKIATALEGWERRCTYIFKPIFSQHNCKRLPTKEQRNYPQDRLKFTFAGRP